MLTSTTAPASQGIYQQVKNYLEMVRFSHTIFALPFAMLATAWSYLTPIPEVAGGGYVPFRIQDLIGVLLCMVSARSFAMGINRLLDHRIDAENPRTATRHLPRGVLSRQGVAAFCVLCAVAFVASCALFLPNRWPLLLALPVLLFLAGYSLTKRFTRFAHFWLGCALMLAPVCAWLAIRGQIIDRVPSDLMPVIWLGGIVSFWVAGFDIIYACQDYAFDRDAGLHSIPAKLGIANALRIAKLCHAFMWIMSISMPWVFPSLGLGWVFGSAVGLVGVLLAIEHRSVSEQSLEKMNLAFFQLNAVISVIFLVVGTVDVWW
ncbi:UbiA-like polyprenyltransferase [Pirellulaceae bacterium SH467]